MIENRFKSYLFVLAHLFVFGIQPAGAKNEPASQDETYYNELYKGQSLRKRYRPLSQYLQDTQNDNEDEELFLKSSKKAFQNDNALDPVPRILLPTEAAEIRRGVEQRAVAIREFLKDHYSGKKKYARAGVIPQDIVRQIVARAGESGYEGLVNPNTISFMYGPDIIRDRDGSWRVIEDNPGFIGGIGDLKLAYELMIEKHKGLDDAFEFVSPMKFYRNLARSYRERAERYGGLAILYMTPPYADNEDARIEKIFAAEGVETITQSSSKKLAIHDDGVYVRSNLNGEVIEEKVGYVFMNGEHAWMDNTHPAAKTRNILDAANGYIKEKRTQRMAREEIENLLLATDSQTHLPQLTQLQRVLQRVGYLDPEKSPAPGLLQKIIENKVGCNYSPGVDFIGDKEFYVYVEDLIRFYLKEEPILKNIPTQKFVSKKTGLLKSKMIRKISEQKNEFVVKKVDGRGGDSVWVGAKMNQVDFDQVLVEVSKNPSVYIVQKFTHLSVLGENIVDLRAISAVFPDQVIVAKTPWGRGLPMDGNGKVNLSDEGREVTVLVVKNKIKKNVMSCDRIFLEAVGY